MVFANKKTLERKKSDEFRDPDFTRKVISLLDPKLYHGQSIEVKFFVCLVTVD